MKQKDIILIIVVSFFGIVLSVIISKVLFNTAANQKLQSEIVTAISPEFQLPDKKYFNQESINPTQTIRIGNDANNQPFNQ